MRLRNKKTGEIIETFPDRFVINSGEQIRHYDSLVELNAEWEDVPEEPKDNNYWYIDDFGRIQFSSEIVDEIEGHPNNWMARKLFGNYFGTREEAEKAVEKLKAWKRLKDMGFKIEGIRYRNSENYIEWSIHPKGIDEHFDAEAFNEILHSLFGGEE